MFDLKNVRCLLGIENFRGKLRLRFPRAVRGGKGRYISTGLDATPENFKKTQQIALRLEEELLAGTLTEEAIAQYVAEIRNNNKAYTTLSVLSGNSYSNTATQLDVVKLWEMYAQHREGQVAETTFKREYQTKYLNHMKALADAGIPLTDGAAIREWLLQHYSPDTAKRVLIRLNAAYLWGMSIGITKQPNPFTGLAASIKLGRRYQDGINPFSAEEKNAILKAFEEHPKHRHYYNFVRFLFLTGCRTGEAIALRWKHISSGFSYITFAESYDSQLKIRKCTKTGHVRRFPCNAALRELLLAQQTAAAILGTQEPDDLVFRSPTGLPICNSKFSNQIWRGCRSGRKIYKGVVTQLVEQGLVSEYRPLYNTRHTFITMCLEAGMTAPQVAKLVGNSAEVIMRHYAGNILRFDVPVS